MGLDVTDDLGDDRIGTLELLLTVDGIGDLDKLGVFCDNSIEELFTLRDLR